MKKKTSKPELIEAKAKFNIEAEVRQKFERFAELRNTENWKLQANMFIWSHNDMMEFANYYLQRLIGEKKVNFSA